MNPSQQTFGSDPAQGRQGSDQGQITGSCKTACFRRSDTLKGHIGSDVSGIALRGTNGLDRSPRTAEMHLLERETFSDPPLDPFGLCSKHLRRCSCGFHPPSQGHREGCPRAGRKPATLRTSKGCAKSVTWSPTGPAALNASTAIAGGPGSDREHTNERRRGRERTSRTLQLCRLRPVHRGTPSPPDHRDQRHLLRRVRAQTQHPRRDLPRLRGALARLLRPSVRPRYTRRRAVAAQPQASARPRAGKRTPIRGEGVTQ